MILALCKELELRKDFLSQPIETLYFGGGTPSLLTKQELEQIFSTIRANFSILPNAEISFECNPDDITEEYCKTLRSFGINRLSIGIQSLYDEDLKLLNRRHSADSAKKAVKIAQSTGFQNITVDLIYGLPNMTLDKWKHNLDEISSMNIQHLSAYSLMVEEHTALNTFIRKGKFILPPEDSVLQQFEYLLDWSEMTGFKQYEISNFAKNEMISRHNSAYWEGDPYLGIGPSAHSYDGTSRYWNISHNNKYISAINSNTIPYEKEILTSKDKYNELILTKLRMNKGLETKQISNNYPQYYDSFTAQKEQFLARNLVQENNGIVSLTRKGIMLSDTVMSDFFIL